VIKDITTCFFVQPGPLHLGGTTLDPGIVRRSTPCFVAKKDVAVQSGGRSLPEVGCMHGHDDSS
jgi:hypothetical protein